ncbi:zinc-binding dehydrogenase, partial [Acinetobacter baumannii]
TVPEWQHEVLRLTGGAGADVVVEVGGYDTMARSIAATRLGGVVSITGLLRGFAGVDFGLRSLFDVAKHLHGVIVGSRT